MTLSDKINEFILSLPTGVIYLTVILGAGIFLTFKLRFLQFRYFFRAFKDVFKVKSKGDKSSLSPFQAATTALAGTLGTGNIIGVATAITSGGPGAVFWMCVSSFFGMATKFSEILLSLVFRTTNKKGERVGGPMYYIQKGLNSKFLAVLFSFGCIFASFGVGNISQANAVSDAMYSVFGIEKWVVGIFIMLIVGLILIGGVKRIGAVTEMLVPFMGLTYIIGAFVAIIINYKNIPESISLIFTDAFSQKALSGGVLGFLTRDAVRFGISRGVFSNEAGMGSSPIAHGSADIDNEVKQSLWGIIEVFLDTVLMCTVTALVILTSGEYKGVGASIVTNAFSASLGNSAGVFIAISTFFFAIAGMIGWAYYGEKAIEFITQKEKWITVYRVCFVISILIGAVTAIDLVWNLSDLLNLIMALPNTIALIVLCKIVSDKSNDYFEKSPKNSKK